MSEQYWNPAAECAPLHETEHLQSLRLSRVIRKVYDNVAYYRKKNGSGRDKTGGYP